MTTTYEGTPAEVLAYQAYEESLGARLTKMQHPLFMLDLRGSLPLVLAHTIVNHSHHYRTNVAEDFTYEYKVIEDDATASDGSPIDGFTERWRHPDGRPMITFNLKPEANPLHVLHEAAHALDITADHGEVWQTHFATLVAERYGQ